MEWRPPLHLGVVAVEKGAFGSPDLLLLYFMCQEKKTEGDLTPLRIVLMKQFQDSRNAHKREEQLITAAANNIGDIRKTNS